MTEAGRPLKIFLSYASQDKPAVQDLASRLVDEDWIDAWLDIKKLLPGEDWRIKIEEAVETSDIVIICLSNNSVTKEGYVQKELRYAREIALEKPEDSIFLIPLRLDECEVPRGLRFYQWGDYFGEKKEETYEALLESLKLRYEQKLKLEAKERAQREKAEQERIALEERARKESEEKARLEAEERARWEREEQERKIAKAKEQKEAEEKGRQEAENRARIEKEEKDRKAAELAAQEKEKRETAEKAKREKAERDAEEEAIGQKAKRDAAEKAKHEKAVYRAAQISTLKENISRSFNSLESNIPRVFSRLRIVSLFGIAIAIFWLLLNTPFKPISLLPTSTPSVTTAPGITLIPSNTSKPNMLLTKLAVPTFTKTNTPTVTPTPTPVPTSSILLQEDFEDGVADKWNRAGSNSSIEKDSNGNHYWSVSPPENKYIMLTYGDRWTRWTDYAFESRIKFVKGPQDLGISVRLNGWVMNYSFYIYSGTCSFDQNTDVKGLHKILRGGIPRSFDQDRFYTIRVEIKGDVISAYVDNVYLSEAKIPAEMINNVPTILNKQGGIGYGIGGGETINIDDIKVWSLK